MNELYIRPVTVVVNNIEVVFREEYSKLIAILVGRFGRNQIELIEDAVQEAIIKAMQGWSVKKPDNPAAWLNRVATNYMLDQLKRSETKNVSGDEALLKHQGETNMSEAVKIKDQQLQMIFACCDPKLSLNDQLLLSLRYLCGFGISEIARALVRNNDAIEKALDRAKAKFRDIVDREDLPNIQDHKSRISSVLKVIYLQFNEGYKVSKGSQLVNYSICLDSIKLAEQLIQDEPFGSSETNALLALMYFQSARFSTRVDQNGNLLTLENQERKHWDQIGIQKGMIYLGRAYSSGNQEEYYLQAAIAAYHASAVSYEETPWSAILEGYDSLLVLNDNPVFRLNRLIAFSKVSGPKESLKMLTDAPESYPESRHPYTF